jgi:CubicO group peptidase (beta-lactamase class C family)
MSTGDKNPVVKTRAGEVRESLASGVVDAFEMKARVKEILNRRPAVGLAVGVVRNGSLEFFSGHGLADIASNTPITEDTVFRIASITKTFTTIAVMQLWEQGRIDLDAPANDYLRAYKLIPAQVSFRPATVRHLLTHTAGIPEVVYASDLLHPGWGPFFARSATRSVKVGEPLPKLSEYYRGGLRLVVEPGSAFAYSNHGFATLGQIIEDVSGMPLERYLREHIFEPLGMAASSLVRSGLVASRLATGYVLGSGGARAVPDREWVGAGAEGIYSTPRDMARYLAALLGGGANEHGRVLGPRAMAMMFEPHYQPDPRIPGIGLAFFRSDMGGHLAVEHGGILPGFTSELFVAPDDGVGVMAFTNGASGAMGWLPLELGQLLRHLLAVPDESVRRDVPHHPEVWDELCGRYQLPQHISDLRVRVMMGGGAQVFVRDGQLMVRGLSPIPALSRGLPLHPDDETDPHVFRLDTSQFGMPTVHIVFGHEDGVGTTAVHTDLVSQPLSLFKRPATSRRGASLTLALGALAAVSAVRAVRRRRRPYKEVEA